VHFVDEALDAIASGVNQLLAPPGSGQQRGKQVGVEHERVVPDLCSSIRAPRFGVVVSGSTSLCPCTGGMTKYPVGELPQVVEEARE
jgi:hypothetical protein